MRILTSYYAKCKNGVKGAVLIPVSTGVPPWFIPENEPMRILAPGWDLVNGIKHGEIDEEEYTKLYKEKLSKISISKVLEQITFYCNMYGVDNAILLCWENSEDFCHRHIIADWLPCDIVEWDGSPLT